MRTLWPLRLLRVALPLLLALGLSACGATLPRVPVNGSVLGRPLETTVDSPLAKYYLENYLAGQRGQSEWDSRFDRLHQQPGLDLPSTRQLQELSREYSVDTAALFYAQRLLEHPQNRELQVEFERRLKDLQAGSVAYDTLARELDHRYRIVFIPGWLYRSKPWTGADFAGPRALLTKLGIEHNFIELEDNGTVEDNARLIADGLAPLLQGGKPVILVSGSKGSPEVALALSRLLSPEQTKPIIAWLNICGALYGSPLADKWTTWPSNWLANVYFHLMGWGGLKGMASLRTEFSQQRAKQTRLPEHIYVVNYIGVPMSGDIQQYTKQFTYVQLRNFGPNDGLVLIPDEIDTNGATVTEVGRGHFLSYPDIDVRTTALLRAVIHRLETSGKEPPETGVVVGQPPLK